MERLFTIDLKDYDENGKRVYRPSVRGIIYAPNGKIALVHSKKHHYYKFPGGGIEAGENHAEALIREVKEETGLTVIPDSIREFGNVLRVQKGNEAPDVIFEQENFYYTCQVEAGVGAQMLDSYEEEAQFELCYVTPEEAIAENAAYKCDDLFAQLMIDRERRVLELINKADIKWLDNPEVFRINQLPAHSDHAYFLNYKDLGKKSNGLTRSLNGQWKFCFSKNAKCRPANFYEVNYDSDGFDKITVPGHIELAGYDQIRYINIMYPWEGKEYRRAAYTLKNAGDGSGMFSEAEYNPVGSYITSFDLDEELSGRRIRICFEGVEQAMYLWLNGQFIGYAEDSFTPSEFELTPYVKEKGNVLAVEVHKMSTAAFLEDQDFFRFFGIFRNVTLKAIPDTHVEDLWINPTLKQDNKSGQVSVNVRVSSIKEQKEQKLNARFLLKDKEGCLVCEKKFPIIKAEALNYAGHTDVEIPSVKPWDNHEPYLYQAFVEIMNEKDEILEIVPYNIGFRRVEIIDKVIHLNGKRLVLTGVNRHEWSAKTGRCIGMKEMVSDMDCMQKNNINAVRTCHYPDQIPWYYMCDEAGIYVMAETNLESHGSFQKLGAVEPSCNVPGSVPQWREAVIDRARSNYETFKNHTSVLFWSLGNESYVGDNIEAMNTFLKEKNDGRLTHYESVIYNRAYEDTVSDVESRMYAKPAEVEAYLQNNPKKPYILCEFMHDMGNSMGGLGSYMKLIDLYDMYQGGFSWDFIDQALFVKDEITGKEVLRYGGDFDDRPSDYEFSGNGIVFADRREKPAMQEVRYYYGLYK